MPTAKTRVSRAMRGRKTAFRAGDAKRPLFDGLGVLDGQSAIAEAEAVLLDIADYVYAHTSLKPISKTLFFISRCLCVAKLRGRIESATDLCQKYEDLKQSLDGAAPADDFEFSSVVAECESHVPRVIKALNKVCRLTDGADSLGLAFNTLLRGKFEGGEGMGTFLTPEEVVFPMVDMLFSVVGEERLNALGKSLLFGDICGGTGRFVYAIARRLEKRGVSAPQLAKSARLFDQSTMAVDLAKLNFLFEGMVPRFQRVGDSLVAPEVSSLKSRFLLLATNPPFGAGKYRWNQSLTESLPSCVLSVIGMKRNGDSTDPSELFFFRNVDLLARGGALAIILPDGVMQSKQFRDSIVQYERARTTRLHIAAIVSLPSVTFSLGGTVAKTSFVVVQKDEEEKSLYVALANHVGFVKRGKKRANDPCGNDLENIAEDFSATEKKHGRIVECWREHETLAPAKLLHSGTVRVSVDALPLGDLVEMRRDFRDKPRDPVGSFHISVLDVDESGLVDVVAATRNQPMSRGLACKSGDILLSCMNPRIWRVAVVPDLPGSWSCSPEFVVLRPKRDSWRVAIALHHPDVMGAVQAMAKGTSSSRQRVPKDRVLTISVPEIEVTGIAEYVKWREEYYRSRLHEAQAYDAVHGGGKIFNWYI